MIIVKELCEVFGVVRSQLSIYQLCILVVQILIAFWLAAWTPLVIRSLCLPSLMHFTSPLYFTFTTCYDQLSGVCSFPTALVPIYENGWELARGVDYDVDVEVTFFDTDDNDRLGAFQVLFEGFDQAGTRTASFKRTAFFKRPSPSFTILMKRLVFLPLYLVGFFGNDVERGVRVPLTDRFSERPFGRTVTLSVQLQSRLAQVESGVLVLRARVGLFRTLLYYYPISSSLALCGVSLAVNLSFVAIYWACVVFKGFLNRQCSESEFDDIPTERARIASGASSGYASAEFFPGSNEELCSGNGGKSRESKTPLNRKRGETRRTPSKLSENGKVDPISVCCADKKNV